MKEKHPMSNEFENYGPVDVDAILASLPEECSDPGEDPWGGANLDPGDQYDSAGIETQYRRFSRDS